MKLFGDYSTTYYRDDSYMLTGTSLFITRADGTTAAERLCQYKSPDLIESLVNTFGTSILSIPRNRNGQNALGTL